MGSGTILQPVVMQGGDLMAGNTSSMGTLTLQGGLRISPQSGLPMWTLKIDGNGNSDQLNFGYVPGISGPSCTLSLSGTCSLLLTGTPLPSTSLPYTIITNAHAGVNLNNLIVQPPLGFTAALAESDYVYDYNFPNLYTVTMTLTGPSAWNVSGSGNWSSDSNWGGGVPK